MTVKEATAKGNRKEDRKEGKLVEARITENNEETVIK